MKIDGYKFGTKNNWRKWAWNRIEERCKALDKPKKEMIIVYLAGIEDLDRKVAVSKGFNPNNMIAIDKNKDVISTLKDKGVLCLKSSLIDAITSFDRINTKIDILIADLCCGLTDDTIALSGLFSSSWQNCFNDNAVILLNLMRGREDTLKTIDMFKENLNIYNYYNFLKQDEKHRGALFFTSILISCTYEILKELLFGYCELNNIKLDTIGFKKNSVYARDIFNKLEQIGLDKIINCWNNIVDRNYGWVFEQANEIMLDIKKYKEINKNTQYVTIELGKNFKKSKKINVNIDIDEIVMLILENVEKSDGTPLGFYGKSIKKVNDIHEIIGQYLNYCKSTYNPQFNEYINKNIHMDSVIFTLNTKDGACVYSREIPKSKGVLGETDVSNSLRALMAVRTMRQNGTLSPCPSY